MEEEEKRIHFPYGICQMCQRASSRHLELLRTLVVCNPDAPIHTESIMYSGAYSSMGVDNRLQLDHFRNNFRVELRRLNKEDMVFDMIGIDAAIANAFQRILIAELPTMTIEKVLIANNTSIIQDEVLPHRLGLIPINVDPRLFDSLSANDQPNEKNTIVFKLHVQCKRGDPPVLQEIELEAHAVKGIGKTHAKWSPVATAWYRMLP